MIITLTGFMGTGKTTIGRLLAERFEFLFLDSDALIELATGKSIPQIFNECGEKFFRHQEKIVLKRVLLNQKNIVFAIGGGAVLSPDNRTLMKKYATVICLTAEATEIYERLKNSNDRPLLNTENPLKEIKQLMKERQKYYQIFPHQIDTTDQKPEDIVDKIYNRLVKKDGLNYEISD